MKVPAYCEIAFLEELVKNLSALKGSRFGLDIDAISNSHIRQIEELIYRNSELYFNNIEELRHRAKAFDGIYFIKMY